MAGNKNISKKNVFYSYLKCHFIRADHGELCEGVDVTYCMNGGTCYKITSMDTLTCV